MPTPTSPPPPTLRPPTAPAPPLPPTPTAPPPLTPALPAVPPAAPPATPPSPTLAIIDVGTPSPARPPRATATPLPEESPQPDAWRGRRTPHYDLHYLLGSRAARDIDLLARAAEAAMGTAAAALQVSATAQIHIYFVNRIFWQGGASYSDNQLLLSYPEADRDYTATSLVQVLRHETAHALVEQLLGSPDHKGGLLGEGVAVWAAGGHYQAESLDVLASTLITDNARLYLPLADLRHDFYNAQHEIAYLEGGAYVQFLVARWGLPRFKQYLDQPTDPAPLYGLDSAALEAAWRTWLAGIPHTAADAEAVRLRVRYYDLMRRYETTLDSDARLLPGVLPADWGPTLIHLFSHPAPANVRIEQDFVRAGRALWSHDLPTCTRLLDTITARLPDE